MSERSDRLRAEFKKEDDERDAGLVTPDNVVRYDDIQYGPYGEWNLLDVYRPKDSEGKKLPVIVNVHGGGWVYGTKETYQFYCMSLVKYGFAVVNFTYRLAPEYKFPANFLDINAVFEWILKNADEYGFDTENIFAMGDSAGANMLTTYAGIATCNTDVEEAYGFTVPDGLKISGVGLNCGIYSFYELPPEDPKMDVLQDYFENPEGSECLRYLSAVRYITPNFPPASIMTCENDPLKLQQNVLAGALLRSNVFFSGSFVVSSKRKLGHVFHCNIRLPEAEANNYWQCQFFLSLIERKKMK